MNKVGELDRADSVAAIDGDHHQIGLFEYLVQPLEFIRSIVERFSSGQEYAPYLVIGTLQQSRNKAGTIRGEGTRYIDECYSHCYSVHLRVFGRQREMGATGYLGVSSVRTIQANHLRCFLYSQGFHVRLLKN